MPENPRWKRRLPGSTWGDWGPDDQLGRLNLLTPDKVLKGVAEVKEGRTFCLSMPLDYPGGSRQPAAPPAHIARQSAPGHALYGLPARPRGYASGRRDLRRHRRDDAAIFDAVGQ